jgi:hypothetical protein
MSSKLERERNDMIMFGQIVDDVLILVLNSFSQMANPTCQKGKLCSIPSYFYRNLFFFFYNSLSAN